MRLFLILCWLMVPVLAWAFHLGPGQELTKLDKSAELVQQASVAAAKEDYSTSSALYSDALNSIPADRTAEAQAIRLELA